MDYLNREETTDDRSSADHSGDGYRCRRAWPPPRSFAEFAAATTFDDLPTSVIEDAKLAILDWFGSMLAGALEPQARIARKVVQLLGAADDAALFPHARSSAAGAALGNGVASHILEFDDVHKGSTLHAAAPILPPPSRLPSARTRTDARCSGQRSSATRRVYASVRR